MNGSQNYKKIEAGKCERMVDGDSDAYRVGCKANVEGQCNLSFQGNLVFDQPMQLSEILLRDYASENVTVQGWIYSNEEWVEVLPILQGEGKFATKSAKGSWSNVTAVRINANGECAAQKGSCTLENRVAEVRVYGETSKEVNTLRVTSPNGGEKWQIYGLHTIKWEPYDPMNGINPAGDFTAYLEKEVDGEFESVGKIIEGGKASIHWSGELDTFGNWAKPGRYYVRIVNNKTGEEDRSDRSFEIVPYGTVKADLKVEGKDAPFYVAESKKYKVSWSSNADYCWLYNPTIPWEQGGYLDLKPDGSMMIELNPNGEPYSQTLSLGCDATTKIEGYGYDNVELLPTPGSFVNIYPPVSGKEAEPLQVNLDQRYFLYWGASNDIKNVSIALYKNDKHFKWIATDLPNGLISTKDYSKGSWPNYYEWSPSKTISEKRIGPNDTFKIYILGQKARGGTVTDMSDEPFTIVP